MTTYDGETGKNYKCAYKFSDIRTWLNTTFYSCAFSDTSRINETKITAKQTETGYSYQPSGYNGYKKVADKIKTYELNDKVYMFSKGDLTDELRKSTSTDYALCQGSDGYFYTTTSKAEQGGESDGAIYATRLLVNDSAYLGDSADYFCVKGVKPVITIGF